VAARQAIARDSLMALPTAMLSLAVLALDFDAHEAERLARRAVALDPPSAWAHAALSQALFASRRMDEAVLEAGRAWDADSLSSLNGSWYGWALIAAHRLDSAAALLPRLRAVAPAADADQIEGLLLAARGDFREATPLLSWRAYGGAAAGVYLSCLLARGDTAAVRAAVDSMRAARTTGYFNPLALAEGYALLGDVDQGLEWLQRAFDDRTIWLTTMRLDDALQALRADPRYAALDRQLKY